MTEPAIVPPGRANRPGTVVWAAVCYWLAGVLVLAQSAQVVYDMATVGELTRRAGRSVGATRTDIADQVGSAHALDAFGLVLAVTLAALLFAAGIRFRRGSHRARVLGIVAAALVLLCCTGTLAGNFLGNVLVSPTELEGAVTTLAQQQTPAWVGWLTLAALLVYPLLIAGVVLLLAPSANRYYRPYAGYFAVPLPNP